MTPPPRLHVIPATGCDKALVLRRGPSRHVLSVLWDRAQGTFEMGQWLKGRIYEHRSDLSPDAGHMVYFAGNGQRWWTVVSRAPWLRAVGYYPQTHTWGGGGAFDREGRLWFNGAPPDAPLPHRLKPAPAEAFPHATDGFHMGGMYQAMMRLRGWAHVAGTGYDARLSKALPGGWTLELSFAVSERNRSIISNRYALVNASLGVHLDQPDWEWAEPFGSGLQVAKSGCLWDVGLDADGPTPDSRQIRDFAEMTFTARTAPYAGISDQASGR